jgi:hypothetical protein
MKKLTHHVAVPLLLLGLSWPVSAQTTQSIKIGVLSDASGPYSDCGGEGSVTGSEWDMLEQVVCSAGPKRSVLTRRAVSRWSSNRSATD